MATDTIAPPKQADASKSTPLPGGPPKSGDLLTRAHFGTHVTGRVDSVSAVKHSQGKTEKGRDYSFYQQTMTLALGGEMVEINFRADAEPKEPLVMYELDEIVRIKVAKPRVFNGRTSYDVAD